MSFELKPEDLMLLDEDLDWVVAPGTFEAMVGGPKGAFEATSSALV